VIFRRPAHHTHHVVHHIHHRPVVHHVHHVVHPARGLGGFNPLASFRR
jgi:hypothetical protein